jgi:hypothetical protein
MPYSSEKPSRWSRLSKALWALWFALTLIGFAILEAVGLRREGDEWPPLTYVIRRYLPAWLFFAGLGGLVGWLVWHFVATYLT